VRFYEALRIWHAVRKLPTISHISVGAQKLEVFPHSWLQALSYCGLEICEEVL